MAHDRRKWKTRERILDAAPELFARRGFEGARVVDIARRAEVGHGTVFWHFVGKTQLYAHVLQLAGDRFLSAMRPHADGGRATLSESLARWVCVLGRDDEASALLGAERGRHPDPAIAAAAESVHGRLVDFRARRLHGEGALKAGSGLRRQALARLIVAAAWAMVAASPEVPAAVRSALVADFGTAVERMTGRHDRSG